MEISLKVPLKELLQGAVQGDYSQSQLRELHRLCYTIALHLIRRKIFAGKLNTELIALSESDIAFDCIADVFQRDDNGEFTELCKYFGSQRIEIEHGTEEILLVHLRRFICTVVNDNLFRIYNEADPALGKIIRNIKLGVEKSTDFALTEIFDEQYLLLTSSDPLLHLPTMSDEELHSEVSLIMSHEDEVPCILGELARFLSDQADYQRKVRLLSLAVALKNGYEQARIPYEAKRSDAFSQLDMEDAERTIREACREIENDMRPRYIAKGKIDSNTFSVYIRAIENILCSEFLAGHDDPPSYYEALTRIKPGITSEEYKKKHRVIFEYLVKLARERAKKHMRRM